jgi:hypothetical protein
VAALDSLKIESFDQAQVVSWCLNNLIRQQHQWTATRKATAAALLAAAAHDCLASLQLAAGLGQEATTNRVLASLVGIQSDRLVAYALRALRVDPNRFRRALAGGRKQVTLRALSHTPMPGSRADAANVDPVDWTAAYWRPTLRPQLFLFDADLLRQAYLTENLLFDKLRPDGLCVFLATRWISVSMLASRLRAMGSTGKAPFHLLLKSRCLYRIRKPARKQATLNTRRVLVFARKKVGGKFSDAHQRAADNYHGWSEFEIGLKEPPGVRELRARAYQRLMRSFSPRDGVVLAPCCLPPEGPEESTCLRALRTAAHRTKRKLVLFKGEVEGGYA